MKLPVLPLLSLPLAQAAAVFTICFDDGPSLPFSITQFDQSALRFANYFQCHEAMDYQRNWYWDYDDAQNGIAWQLEVPENRNGELPTGGYDDCVSALVGRFGTTQARHCLCYFGPVGNPFSVSLDVTRGPRNPQDPPPYDGPPPPYHYVGPISGKSKREAVDDDDDEYGVMAANDYVRDDGEFKEGGLELYQALKKRDLAKRAPPFPCAPVYRVPRVWPDCGSLNKNTTGQPGNGCCGNENPPYPGSCVCPPSEQCPA